MTVEELIQKLSEFPPETLVVMSQDEEGNSFGILYEVGMGYFDSEEKTLVDFDQDDPDEWAEECVVLWP